MTRTATRKLTLLVSGITMLATAAISTGASTAAAAARPAARSAAIAAAHRDLEIHRDFGRLYATISWHGPNGGPYSGIISGTTYDDRSDGDCVKAYGLADGHILPLDASYTCRAIDHDRGRSFLYKYGRRYSIKLALCKLHRGKAVACTSWY
jgi:hypothetical protein